MTKRFTIQKIYSKMYFPQVLGNTHHGVTIFEADGMV